MNSRIEIDLSGNHWKIQGIRPGQGVKEGFRALASECQRLSLIGTKATAWKSLY